MNDIVLASELLQEFKGDSFKNRVSELQASFCGAGVDSAPGLIREHKLGQELFTAALLIKHNSSQINEVIHTLGILIALPGILEHGEKVTSLSLAAGNTGKGFDLVTSHRIAEFTFIEWQGGPEVIRQNKVFKDFYFLAEEGTDKQRELYAIGTSHVHAFLNGQRRLPQILNGNAKLGNSFRDLYGNCFKTV
ncbi:MAG: hypothetical protein JRF64_10530, partial [Deltaproteobacteria bacterium]|nr:hypothetical protein [Deltaproteobacteria bacterium]